MTTVAMNNLDSPEWPRQSTIVRCTVEMAPPLFLLFKKLGIMGA